MHETKTAGLHLQREIQACWQIINYQILSKRMTRFLFIIISSYEEIQAKNTKKRMTSQDEL
jgi:hypothetical protein